MKISVTKRTYILLIVAAACQLIALLLMANDPEAQGLGSLSLWVAPIIMIVGLILPFVAFARGLDWKHLLQKVRRNYLQGLGFSLSTGAAFLVYLMTLEPTASLWDCSEAIAAAYKLQVSHTPGTPLTLLLGRLFSMLAMGDVIKVAWCINLMSGMFSALAVGLTFLIIWYFGEKMVHSKLILFIASLGGALCLAFSDSYWFSAVEAETYGPSVFFMMLLIWLSTLRSAVEQEGNLLLAMSYLMGLAYCIHPMCILVLPVCVLIWKSATDQQSVKNQILSFVVGVAFVLFINKVVAVDLFEWAFQLDLFLVNKLSMPFYSGVVVLLGFIGVLAYLLWSKWPKSRIGLLVIGLVVWGFVPYIMLFVRSAQMTPINEFVPNNLAKIKPYMNRESYPGRPLVYGPYFDAQITDVVTKASAYVVKDDGYEKVGELPEYNYSPNRQTILPRIYSNDPAHIKVYRQWTGLGPDEKPRFSDNLNFMMKYQLGQMYGRYLLWNFAGRNGDKQHAGWAKPWEGVVDREAISYNRANNQYFMLPFLLGLLGLLFQLRKDSNGFWANMAFFIITGLLLAAYLNGTPNEPRERDYIYVGSYVAFSIWIGLGMLMVLDYLDRRKVSLIGSVILIVPIWMLYQNYDDHNRADRTFQMDYARSVLGSCEPNAILFSGGDNDTFPLWYLQEVEGFRTDVRVMVLSYFNTDWYINQLTHQSYDSPPFQLTLAAGANQYGPYDPVYIQEQMKTPISWKKYMEALNQRNPQLMFQNRGSELFLLPSRKLSVTYGKESMELQVSGGYLPKSEMAILDLIQSNEDTRPIYFNYTSINSLSTNFKEYVVQEGMVYRLTSVTNHRDIPLDMEKTLENLVENIDYSNLSNAAVYFNFEDYQARMINPLRYTFNQMIRQALLDGNKGQALELATFAYENLYQNHLAPSYANLQMSHFMKILQQDDVSEEINHFVFAYLSDQIAYEISRNESIDRNDVLVLQEAVRLLDDVEVESVFNLLMEQLNQDS